MKDPVCWMTVDPQDCAGSAHHAGVEYFFCSTHCVEEFKKRPESYLTEFAAQVKAPVPDASADAVYTCPMHPEVSRVGFGTCPQCGMALEPVDVSLAQEGPNPELVDFSRRLKVAAVLAVPLLVFAMSEMDLGTWTNWIQLDRKSVV